MSDLLNQISEVTGPNGMITGDAVRQRPADWTGQGDVVRWPSSVRLRLRKFRGS